MSKLRWRKQLLQFLLKQYLMQYRQVATDVYVPIIEYGHAMQSRDRSQRTFICSVNRTDFLVLICFVLGQDNFSHTNKQER